MNELAAIFSPAAGETTWESALLVLLSAFALGHLVAFTYERTFEGMSYSRSFVQSMVLSSVVAATLMLAIGDNLARGLGVMGTMALVRYRTNIRDPRDMVFMFAALAVGLAVGVRSFPAAVFGTVAFCAAAASLQWTTFGQRKRFDGMLRFWLPRSGATGDDVRAPNLSDKVPSKDDAALTDVIRNGKGDMPAVTLTDTELRDLLGWLRSTFP